LSSNSTPDATSALAVFSRGFLLASKLFFGYIVVRLRGERGVVIEVSKLAVVKGDFAMEITQEISIVLKLRLFHGTILPMMKKGGLMTALFGGLLIS